MGTRLRTPPIGGAAVPQGAMIADWHYIADPDPARYLQSLAAFCEARIQAHRLGLVQTRERSRLRSRRNLRRFRDAANHVAGIHQQRRVDGRQFRAVCPNGFGRRFQLERTPGCPERSRLRLFRSVQADVLRQSGQAGKRKRVRRSLPARPRPVRIGSVDYRLGEPAAT